MMLRVVKIGATMALAGLALAGCEKKAADGATVAQGSAPVGTISDEMPNLELLPNDAALADPADVPLVPGASPAAPPAQAEASAPVAQAAPPPAPAEPALEGSIAE
ncbi:hypothetical protein [Blastomonas sp. AAP53]|uniref:hypothetical protein n=1 Tax=Blastomonas sp. AAP53 TaxID=1248760 RepID=UPI0002F5D65C|nr:hypothetical protein [Blastomonas sp. AAP53]